MYFLNENRKYDECQILSARDGYFAEHFHENLEIVLMTGGERTLILNGKTITMRKGDIAFIFPFSLHEYSGDECEYTWLGIHPSFMQDYTSLLLSSLPENPVIHEEDRSELADTIINSLFFSDEKSAVFIKGITTALLCILLPQLNIKNNGAENNNGCILKYMMLHHFDEDFSIARMAHELGMGERKIREYFSKFCGISFSDFLRRYKINDAMNLLRNTDKNITEIAMECGFDSVRTFNRTFFKICGCSPTQFRLNTN